MPVDPTATAGDGRGGGRKHKNRGGRNGGGGSGGGGGGSYGKRVAYAYAWLVDHGLSPNAAAGVVGNLVAESSVDPMSNQQGGPGRGIAQWSEGGRWDSLVAWAGQQNKPVDSLSTQMEFLWHELNTGYKPVLNALQNTTNMSEASGIFMTQFEMPADTSSSALQYRASLGNDVRQNHNPNANYSGFDTGGGGGGGGGAGGGNYVSPKQDNLSPQEMAEQYGWAMSFLKSNNELWDLFQKATDKDWTPQMFAAQLRDTKWFQHNSETVRKNELLKKVDPATFSDRLAEVQSNIKDLAAAMGAPISGKMLQRISENALVMGWNEAQIRDTVSDFIGRVKGSFVGEAGVNEDTLKQYSSDMGVRVSDQYIRHAVSAIGSGNWDENRAKDKILRMAQSQYPTLADQLETGTITVRDAASPYMESMANILELNPAEIDLFDPTIRRALGARGQDGKPAMKTTWEFENDLRQDPRWNRTKNAEDTVMSAGRKILTDFGFSF